MKRKKGNMSSGRKNRESSRSIKNRTMKSSSKLILSNNQIDPNSAILKSPPTKDPQGNISSLL